MTDRSKFLVYTHGGRKGNTPEMVSKNQTTWYQMKMSQMKTILKWKKKMGGEL